MKSILIICIVISGAKFTLAQSLKFDKKVFDTWIETRTGKGDKPTFWYCYGEVYTYPEGKLITKMEGVDMARRIQFTPDSVVQISRKIFIYTDTTTGLALENFNGNKVEHIKYPYQKISYVRKNDSLVTWVTQGAGARIQTIGPGTKTMARMAGKNIIFSAPLFLNFTTPRGKYEAFENYDFITNLQAKKTSERYQLFWNRFGDLPPFAGAGKSIIQLVSYRVDDFEKLSEPLKKYIQEQAPLWLDAPKNEAEIKKIQEGN
jgi:hypothetical protein